MAQIIPSDIENIAAANDLRAVFDNFKEKGYSDIGIREGYDADECKFSVEIFLTHEGTELFQYDKKYTEVVITKYVQYLLRLITIMRWKMNVYIENHATVENVSVSEIIVRLYFDFDDKIFSNSMILRYSEMTMVMNGLRLISQNFLSIDQIVALCSDIEESMTKKITMIHVNEELEMLKKEDEV